MSLDNADSFASLSGKIDLILTPSSSAQSNTATSSYKGYAPR